MRIKFLDGLRGIAAMWVVLFHASEGHHIDALKQALPSVMSYVLFDLGNLGVPIFFALSGFVMMHTARTLVMTPRSAGTFILRRLVRLAPPYYFAIAFSIIIALVKSKALHLPVSLPATSSLIIHALFLQHAFALNDINTVFWTLSVEIQFYIAFAIIMMAADAPKSNQNRNRYIALILIGLFASIWPMGLVGHTTLDRTALPYLYGFAIGCLAYLARQQPTLPGIYIITAIVATAGFFTILDDPHQRYFPRAIAVTCILLSFDIFSIHRILESAPLQFLGKISYSLYLLHNPVTGALFNVLKRLGPQSAAGNLFHLLAACTGCIIVSFFAYKLVELPSQTISKRVGGKANAIKT